MDEASELKSVTVWSREAILVDEILWLESFHDEMLKCCRCWGFRVCCRRLFSGCFLRQPRISHAPLHSASCQDLSSKVFIFRSTTTRICIFTSAFSTSPLNHITVLLLGRAFFTLSFFSYSISLTSFPNFALRISNDFDIFKFTSQSSPTHSIIPPSCTEYRNPFPAGRNLQFTKPNNQNMLKQENEVSIAWCNCFQISMSTHILFIQLHYSESFVYDKKNRRIVDKNFGLDDKKKRLGGVTSTKEFHIFRLSRSRFVVISSTSTKEPAPLLFEVMPI